MTNEELKKYYHEQKIQGRSESQIARSLGMSLSHFIGRLNGIDVDKVDPPKKPVAPKKEKKKADIQSEKIEEPEEDLSWMND